jgi:hypothetical protein
MENAFKALVSWKYYSHCHYLLQREEDRLVLYYYKMRRSCVGVGTGR